MTGNGGLNVILIDGSINASLTLSGGAGDVFIVNVTGRLDLRGSSALGLSGGLTAGQVLYNFVGDRGSLVTARGTTVNGTILAPRARVGRERSG